MEKLVVLGVLCLFFQWSGQGFQNEGLDHLIEMEFSSPWINCYIWTEAEDWCFRIQLHIYVGSLWKPRPCLTPYSDIIKRSFPHSSPKIVNYRYLIKPDSIFHRSFNSFRDVLWKAINLITVFFTVKTTVKKMENNF